VRKVYAEPIGLWQAEVEALRREIKLYELIKHGDWIEQARYVLSDESSFVREMETSTDESIGLIICAVYSARYCLENDPTPEEISFFTDSLAIVASDILETKFGAYSRQTVCVEDNQFELRTKPRNLLGVIWLQFAEAALSHKQFRRCKSCHRWFAAPAVSRGSEQSYCDRSCVMKAQRLRKKKAVQMYSEGITIEEISRMVESSPETLNGWITEPSKR
jgi:hypothetical protein